LPIVRRLLCAVALLSLCFSAPALAHDPSAGTGGATVPDDPEVEQAVCEDDAAWECSPGSRLTLEGESLSQVRVVRFVGRRGRDDDRTARPRVRESHRVEVRVPSAARSGPIAVTSSTGKKARTPRSIRVRAIPPQQPPSTLSSGDAGAFPVVGPHDYGTETNRFGGGRNHGGQDVFAKCGTPLAAVFDATVQHVAFQERAGNHVVLQAADGQSYAYMHMQSAAEVRKGASVRAGEQVGRVGDTGRATGCHLHFEQWTAPGWYEGGSAIDPLPLLRSLDD
jgi:murein DD-endopeptidase MepM/ murein hydrolase activator NlpD